MSKVSKEQVVLENVLTAAIGAALACRNKLVTEPGERAAMLAYYDIITVAQEEAKLIGLKFSDRGLASFDADKELLGQRKAA